MAQSKNRIVDDLTLWLYLPAVILLGIACAIPVYDWAMGSESALAHELTRKGPNRLTRRVIMLFAFLLLPFALRALRWKGWRDSGWQHAGKRSGAIRDFLQGTGFGLVVMLGLMVISLVTGTREWDLAYAPGKMFFSIFSYAIAAVVVGVLEETVARGILFRLMAERWPVVPVLLVVAVIFAWLHFLEASDEAYVGASYGQRLVQILGSSLTGFLRIDHAIIEMTNLALFSVLLCLMYLRTGSIWLAAGFHAGVVYIKRVNGIVANSDLNHPQATFFGNSSDYTDGWLCAIFLLVLTAWFWRVVKPMQRA